MLRVQMAFLGKTGMTVGAQEHIRQCTRPANILTWDGPEEFRQVFYQASSYPWKSVAEMVRLIEDAVGEVSVLVTEPRTSVYRVVVTEKEKAPWEG